MFHKSNWLATLVVAVVTIVAAAAGGVGQQPKQPKADVDLTPPRFLYGHDLKVRPGGERDFTEKTPRVGVELYHDTVRNVLLAISDKGWIAATANPKFNPEQKECKWLTAHDLHARRADEKEFTSKTRKYGVEVYHDRGTQQLLYVCESGAVAFAPLPPSLVTDRGPKLHHALNLKVRRPEHSDFSQALPFGVEVFRDENTPDVLLWIVGESGSLSTATTHSSSAADPNKVRSPETLHGLILRVRRADEMNFSDKTRRLSIDIYRDVNTEGHLVYLCETGAIAVTDPVQNYDPKQRGVSWLGGIALRARPAGEKDFAKARRYQIEIFRDNRTGNLLYVCETGSIAVASR